MPSIRITISEWGLVRVEASPGTWHLYAQLKPLLDALTEAARREGLRAPLPGADRVH